MWGGEGLSQYKNTSQTKNIRKHKNTNNEYKKSEKEKQKSTEIDWNNAIKLKYICQHLYFDRKRDAWAAPKSISPEQLSDNYLNKSPLSEITVEWFTAKQRQVKRKKRKENWNR